MDKKHPLNYEIKSNNIMLVDKDGNKIADLTLTQAVKKAEEQELDLMQVGEFNDKAICKIINYESWLYHENKRKHKQEFKNRSHELKAMNFRPVIGDNDFNLKIKKIKEFIESQHKVKIVIKFKTYRESTLTEFNNEFTTKIMDALADVADFDSKISSTTKEMNFIIKPSKKNQSKAKPSI